VIKITYQESADSHTVVTGHKKTSRLQPEGFKYSRRYLRHCPAYLPLFNEIHKRGWNWHLFPLLAGQVVKASLGHYPQPFLISMIKNCHKSKRYFLHQQTNQQKIFIKSTNLVDFIK
jgi:hypothetical protein